MSVCNEYLLPAPFGQYIHMYIHLYVNEKHIATHTVLFGSVVPCNRTLQSVIIKGYYCMHGSLF